MKFPQTELGTLIVAKVNVDVDGARWKNMMVVAWPLQAKMSQIQLSRHVNRSIECLNRRGNPQLPFLAVNCKRHRWHNVEISWFFHQFSSDFTWNQFWDSRSAKSAIERIYRLMNFGTFWKLKWTKLTDSRAPKLTKKALLEVLNSQILISRKIWVIEKS